ncbi:MAG: 2-oxoglutarate dehydrogenase complex dihydrolipoyllysine-residue succinyltransferase [Planctomycetes bacterium]|nr:2-oxoglutarate dehydrogenase complex dihydrolipoyllysine-residue succinyltransferase [Planctomycetota bacterium]
MAVELKVPSVGESIYEVTIGEWLKGEGDYVAKDEALVALETDKASLELPAPAAGQLTGLRKKVGDSAEVGEVLAMIEEGPAPEGAKDGAQASAAPASKTSAAPAPAAVPESAASAETRIMPAAQRELAARGLDASDVKPTGPGGRLLKEDVLRHEQPAAKAPAQPTPQAPAPRPASGSREERVVPMTPLRKRIAQRLVDSQQSTATLTTFNEVDLSNVIALRKEYQETFVKRYGVKLGFMSFFVKAAIEALKDFPQVNAEIRGETIVYKDYFDIGVAVGGGRGLVVPVLRNAETLSFAEVELAIADFAQRAKANKITLDELQGGTFTISNGGVYGSLLSTPIINPPQSGILGMHNIQERPVAIDGKVEIRPMMYIALSYDHRIIDGRESVTFLRKVKDCVENPTRILLEV